MVKRMRGPRWGLVGAAGAAVTGAAAVWWVATWPMLHGIPVVFGLTLGDLLEIVAILALVVSLFAAPVFLIAAVALPPRRAVDPSWRRTLELYRRTPALARKTPGPAAEAACAMMSDDALRVAAILPGHSAAGQAAARDALKARLRELEPIPEVNTPSFYGLDDLPSARNEMASHNRLRMICVGLGILFVVVTIALIAMNVGATAPVKARAAQAGFDASVLASLDDMAFDDLPSRMQAWPEVRDMMLRDLIAKISLAIAAPFCILYILASWLRARPMRVLMLRKFNDARLGKIYNRLISTNLQDFGHVIALADRHVRRSTFSWIAGMLVRGMQSIPSFVATVLALPVLMVLRATDRTRWGPALVAAPRDFRLLARRLFDRLELNAETTFISKGYLVRTSDDWWRIVVRLMMDSADVIVLDASYVTEGTAWEIETLMQLNLWGRVVRLSLDAQEDEAREALVHAPPGPIFTYDAFGSIQDKAAFADAMFAALEHSVRARAR